MGIGSFKLGNLTPGINLTSVQYSSNLFPGPLLTIPNHLGVSFKYISSSLTPQDACFTPLL